MNEAQSIQLRLMEISSFNDFDGQLVANALRNNRHLWKAAYMTRLNDLIMLRDLSLGHGMNIDTLFILPAKGMEDELIKMANTWSADECFYMGGEEACTLLGSWSQEKRNNHRQILRVWWD